MRIAGAGPAGLACAIELAHAGIAVEVHEARSAVGSRFHGGHQILACFGPRPLAGDLVASLGIGPDQLELSPLHQAVLQDGRGRRITAHSQRPYALLIRRGPDPGTLDTALLHRARALGAHIRTGSRLDAVDADIVATGPSQVDGLALEMVFRSDSPDRIEVLMDAALLPDGYAYLFVWQGRGTLGVTTLSAYRSLDQLLRQALARFAGSAPLDVQQPETARAAMNFFIPRTARTARGLRVGEAAGFQDYLYGLGIRSALLSGSLAARALVAGADYDRLWRAALHPRMTASLVDRYLFERLPGGGGRLLDHARGVDLQAALERAQADAPWKRLLLPWVQARWARRDGGCGHGADVHWCRRAPAGRTVERLPDTKGAGMTAQGGS